MNDVQKLTRFAVQLTGEQMPVVVEASDVLLTESGHIVFRVLDSFGASDGRALFAPGEWRSVLPIAEADEVADTDEVTG